MWLAAYWASPSAGFISSKLQSNTISGWPLAIRACNWGTEIKVVYMGVLAFLVCQCSSAGVLGRARVRSTVAATPLATISAMPTQPISGIWSSNNTRL